MRKNEKGFTLIELLVVIAIIGLLSTLAVVALNSARQKSRDSKRVADIKQIQTALELFFADSSTGYPAAPTGNLGESGALALGSSAAGWGDSVASGDTTYMGLVPKAPTPADCDSGNDYVYTVGGTGNSSYAIKFCLGGTVGDLGSGLHTASQDGIQ